MWSGTIDCCIAWPLLATPLRIVGLSLQRKLSRSSGIQELALRRIMKVWMTHMARTQMVRKISSGEIGNLNRMVTTKPKLCLHCWNLIGYSMGWAYVEHTIPSMLWVTPPGLPSWTEGNYWKKKIATIKTNCLMQQGHCASGSRIGNWILCNIFPKYLNQFFLRHISRAMVPSTWSPTQWL